MVTRTLRAAFAALSLVGGSAAAESLQVTLAPAAAVELQARWRVQGETRWRPSTDVADGLRPGPVTVELLPLSGCTPASPTQVLRLVQGETLHVTLSYDGPACPAAPPARAIVGG